MDYLRRWLMVLAYGARVIEKAYPDFQQWVTDGSCADWWKTPVKGTTVNRGK